MKAAEAHQSLSEQLDEMCQAQDCSPFFTCCFIFPGFSCALRHLVFFFVFFGF